MSDLSRWIAAIRRGLGRRFTTVNSERDGCTKRPRLLAPPRGTVRLSTPARTSSQPTWKPTGQPRQSAIELTIGFRPTTARTGRRSSPRRPSILTTRGRSWFGRLNSSGPLRFRGGLTSSTRPTTRRAATGHHRPSTPVPRWARFDRSGRPMHQVKPRSSSWFPTTTGPHGCPPPTTRKRVSQPRRPATPFDTSSSIRAPMRTSRRASTDSCSSTRRATQTGPCWTWAGTVRTTGNPTFSSTNPLWLPPMTHRWA